MSTPIDRLLDKIYNCGNILFELVIIVIHAKDELTIPYLLGRGDETTKDGDGLCGKFAKMTTLPGSSHKTEEKKKNPRFTELENDSIKINQTFKLNSIFDNQENFKLNMVFMNKFYI